MALPKRSSRPTEKPNEPVAGLDCVDGRARLIGPAGPVHLARRDTGDPDLDSALDAPNWSVAVVNRYRCTGECLAPRDNLRRCRLRRREACPCQHCECYCWIKQD